MDSAQKADEQARESVEELRASVDRADPVTMRMLLTDARSHYGWQSKDVSDDTLRSIYDMAKFGPTSMNQQPVRFVFVRSQPAKERLLPCLMEANRPKAEAAPVTAIICFDEAFYEKMPKVFPINPGARDMFAKNQNMASSNAFRNSTLQAAWFIIAARAHGLDVGPMSGFDPAAISETFLSDTSWKPNFLCNLGYGDSSKVFRRLPRLAFDDVSEII